MELWIARDKDRVLGLFDDKPFKNEYGYWTTVRNCYLIDDDLFPEITFENSPQQVEIKLITCVDKIASNYVESN